jgi:hypothetical protein
MPEVEQETIDLLVSQIKSLEAQLAGLRARVEGLGTAASVRTSADLRGILAGVADSTAEEIDASLYRIKWDDDTSGTHGK